MPAKKKAAKKAYDEKQSGELKVAEVLTVSEAAKLTEEERQAFADANGTVTNDPK